MRREPAPGRAARFERGDEHDAHREEGETVASRLSRDVEKQRRGRGEEEEQDSRECAESRVEPGVTTATPSRNGTTDQTLSAISDSPTQEVVAQARTPKSSWLRSGPARISPGPARMNSTTATTSSCQRLESSPTRRVLTSVAASRPYAAAAATRCARRRQLEPPLGGITHMSIAPPGRTARSACVECRPGRGTARHGVEEPDLHDEDAGLGLVACAVNIGGSPGLGDMPLEMELEIARVVDVREDRGRRRRELADRLRHLASDSRGSRGIATRYGAAKRRRRRAASRAAAAAGWWA